uniref:GB1/RHD3-type G domain-containing protein n=1 Tax=Calidris pygmaea TaxID=425635 RepID=A0A8C3JZP1_9CHAR
HQPNTAPCPSSKPGFSSSNSGEDLAILPTGFSLGSSVQSHTKGVWMWCFPHPRKPGHALVLLDTEGLGDVEKGDTENDTWIFVLTLLLSSTLIYNSKGTIDQQAMEQLQYPCSSKSLLVVSEMDGEGISEDQYLEKALALKAGTSSKIRCSNQTRECICQYFQDRKCFVFDQPAPKTDLERLEELQDDEIDPEFQQQVEKFCGHIWENAPPKTIPGGRIVTGSLLGKLAETYVETIRSGEVPCLESAVLALAQTVNAAAVKEAVKFYQDLMEQRVKLPTETVEELLDLHIGDPQPSQEDNEQESSHKCEAALGDLSRDLDRKLRDGVYNVPGGHELFKGDLQALVEKYQEVPGKGVMAEAVLQEFLQSREDQGKIILKTDHALAEKEKELKSAFRAGDISLPVKTQARWGGGGHQCSLGARGLSSCPWSTSVSRSHGIVRVGRDLLEIIWSNPPAKAGLPRAHHSGASRRGLEISREGAPRPIAGNP